MPRNKIDANKPTIDYSTFRGKMQILRDVQEAKYTLPKGFITLAELTENKSDFQSSHYQKTAVRR